MFVYLYRNLKKIVCTTFNALQNSFPRIPANSYRKANNMRLFFKKIEATLFFPLYNLNTNLWPLKSPIVRTMCWIKKYIFCILKEPRRMIRHTIKQHSSTFKFDPLITLCWGHFNAPYLKMLQVTGVASAFSYVRTC